MDETQFSGIKAAGDWELDVLGVPFGGHDNGTDSDGQFFSANTEVYADQFPSPPVVYYHGYEPDGRPSGEPHIIGKVTKIEKRADGWWYRVVLDRANQYAQRVWTAAQKGTARASSGTILHMARLLVNGIKRTWDRLTKGEIIHWPVAELSLIDAEGQRQPANQYAVAIPAMKSMYEQAGIDLPDIDEPTGEPEAEAEASKGADAAQPDNQPIIDTLIGDTKMDEKMIGEVIEKTVAAKLDAIESARAAQAQKDAEAANLAELKAENEALKEQAAKAGRLPYAEKGVNIHKYGELRPYDNLDAGDMATLVGVLEANLGNKRATRVSDAALKALAMKLEEDKSGIGVIGRQALKAAGIKANEVEYSTLANYGDDWVGVAYSQAIWDAIRIGTPVVAKLPSIEVPRGVESINLPLESGDPTFYKVAENTTYDSTMKYPVPTITSSQMGTAKVSLTLSKMGARVLWSGELEERSLVPFAAQLRQQLQAAGAEYLESAVIDGDNVTTATTNINDIAATGVQGGTEYYLMFDGFRVSPLVTTTANSRSAGGSLDVSDYIETVKLMGGAGINAMDRSKVSFIVDPSTYYKTITLPEVLTRDVFSSPTLEGGQLKGLWGYELLQSANMHRMSSVRKANSAGKVDQDTTTNNAYGAILAVRWDQWKFGFQRRMTLEVDRFAASDTNEIVAMMVCGLIQRDTEASAITYYVGV